MMTLMLQPSTLISRITWILIALLLALSLALTAELTLSANQPTTFLVAEEEDELNM